MADKDDTRYMEVVDPSKLNGKKQFREYVPNLSEGYNTNMFTSAIPESKVGEYELTCGYIKNGNPELYEYMYWIMKKNEQLHDWYHCCLEMPTTNYFPHLRNCYER
jgi:hypothetical protein